MADQSDEETDDPLKADDQNYYKVEKWTKDGTKVDRMLYACNNLAKARDVFWSAVRHRPRIRLTIRRQTRVLDRWPRDRD
jgi:hypothetical protein